VCFLRAAALTALLLSGSGLAVAQSGTAPAKPDMKFELWESVTLPDGTTIEVHPYTPRAPWYQRTEYGELLPRADMEFTFEEIDGWEKYDIGTSEGDSFKLYRNEHGYGYELPNASTILPRSGLWQVRFSPLAACDENPQLTNMVNGMLEGAHLPVISLMGGVPNVSTVTLAFVAPFGAAQVADPVVQVLQQSGYSAGVVYPNTGGANIFPFVVEIKTRKLKTAVKGEVAAVSDRYIFSSWLAYNDQCTAAGFVTFSWLGPA